MRLFNKCVKQHYPGKLKHNQTPRQSLPPSETIDLKTKNCLTCLRTWLKNYVWESIIARCVENKDLKRNLQPIEKLYIFKTQTQTSHALAERPKPMPYINQDLNLTIPDPALPNFRELSGDMSSHAIMSSDAMV